MLVIITVLAKLRQLRLRFSRLVFKRYVDKCDELFYGAKSEITYVSIVYITMSTICLVIAF